MNWCLFYLYLIGLVEGRAPNPSHLLFSNLFTCLPFFVWFVIRHLFDHKLIYTFSKVNGLFFEQLDSSSFSNKPIFYAVRFYHILKNFIRTLADNALAWFRLEVQLMFLSNVLRKKQELVAIFTKSKIRKPLRFYAKDVHSSFNNNFYMQNDRVSIA